MPEHIASGSPPDADQGHCLEYIGRQRHPAQRGFEIFHEASFRSYVEAHTRTGEAFTSPGFDHATESTENAEPQGPAFV
jgi:hypothetical protein